MKVAIIIPARFASTRLPGKPLIEIAGQTMLQRVVGVALSAAKQYGGLEICVATDDTRIATHCDALGVSWIMTPPECQTGSDRVEMAVRQLKSEPELIINLQGDAPFTPPSMITKLIESFRTEPTDVVTPVVQLSWTQLDMLREHKKTTPFSGTCAVFHPSTGRAFWFSKNVIPAIRNEASLRTSGPLSPVYRHVGIYGYQRSMLSRFVALPQGYWESLEGLEQLRILENGYHIRCVPVSVDGEQSLSGIDSAEDVDRAVAYCRSQPS